METRAFGRTELTVSSLGFGCGAVGGLMVRGEPADQERAVAHAVDHGVTFFDTAASYGDGRSETNLGRVLAKLRPAVTVATKFSVRAADRGRVEAAIRDSLTASLRRLGRDSVDLLQLHTAVGGTAWPDALSSSMVLDEVVPALERLRSEGLFRFFGMTGVGANPELHRVIDAGSMQSVQVPYNLLNPSAGREWQAGMTGPDLGQLIRHAEVSGAGSIGIRALAGGALSGILERHPVGVPDVGPIGTGADYAADVAAAQRFRPVVEAAGAESLVEAALRFAIGPGGPSVVLVGVSSLHQWATAVAAAEKGQLPQATLDLLPGIWAASG